MVVEFTTGNYHRGGGRVSVAYLCMILNIYTKI